MKHSLTAFAVTAALLASTGCTTITRDQHATDTASLDAKAMTIAARPTEMGLELSGDATGASTTTRVLGWLVEGDATKASMPVFGQGSSDPLVRLAAYRAARANNADAFYVTRTETDKTGLGFIYGKRTVTVYGKAYKLKDLDMMTAERADKLGTAAAATSKAGIFGFFGK